MEKQNKISYILNIDHVSLSKHVYSETVILNVISYFIPLNILRDVY